MLKNLTAIIAGTLIALATGPVFAQRINVVGAISNLGDTISTLQEAVDNLQNLVEPKTIFVTSSVHNGDLGGLPGADQICQDLADGVGVVSIVPPGDYVALLSTNDGNAAERITPSVGPYIRPDGIYVSANAAALFMTAPPIDNPLISPISITESGEQAGGNLQVWTGTRSSGGPGFFLGHCLSWTDGTGAGSGGTGISSVRTGAWLEFGSVDCDFEFHLYCVGL